MKKSPLYAGQYEAPCIESGILDCDVVLCTSNASGIDDLGYTDYGEL